MIGKFEEMYRDCEEPWHQLEDAVIYSLGRTNVIEILKRLRDQVGAGVLEVGCGLGGFTNRIAVETGFRVTGMDISPSAIEKAKSRYMGGGGRFAVGDVTDISRHQGCGILIYSEIMWYVLDKLDQALACLRERFTGSYLIVQQTFYKNGLQQYGKDYFTNLEELAAYMPFECVCKMEIDCMIGDSYMSGKDSYETVSCYKI